MFHETPQHHRALRKGVIHGVKGKDKGVRKLMAFDLKNVHKIMEREGANLA
jgi:hypothetical protein